MTDHTEKNHSGAPVVGCWNRWHSFSAILLAVAVFITIVVSHGWRTTSLIMGGVVIVVVALMLMRIHWSVRILSKHSQGLSQSAATAEEHYIDVLLRIVGSVEARDKYSLGHSERVGKLSREIGRRLGLGDRDVRQLEIAGLLHDIGMVAIPEQIIAGKAKMGPASFRTVKTHSRIGYDVLKPLESISMSLDAALYHHERMNGTGYPEGLIGDDIPLCARIVAVADAYDAMTHDRPQRLALSSMAAAQELRRCSPAGYDPQCVNALAEYLNLPVLEKAVCI